MTAQKPLVIINGIVTNLPAGDTLAATVTDVDVFSLTNGESSAIVIGTPVYPSAAGACKKAFGTAVGTSRVIGLVADASVAAAASGSIQTDGVLHATTAQWDAVTGGTGGLVAGTQYYLSATTAGQITATAPTTSGQYVVAIGLALSTTELLIGIEKPFAL